MSKKEAYTYENGRAQTVEHFWVYREKAPDQNRTDTSSLEGYGSTIELQAHQKLQLFYQITLFFPRNLWVKIVFTCLFFSLWFLYLCDKVHLSDLKAMLHGSSHPRKSQ